MTTIIVINRIPQPQLKTSAALARLAASPPLQTFSSPPSPGWARNPTEQAFEQLGLYPFSDTSVLGEGDDAHQLVRTTTLKTLGPTLAQVCPTVALIKATVRPILPGAMAYAFTAEVTSTDPAVS